MKKDCLLASTLAFNRVGSLGWPQQTTKPKLKPGQRMITLQHESDQKLAVLLSLDSYSYSKQSGPAPNFSIEYMELERLSP